MEPRVGMTWDAAEAMERLLMEFRASVIAEATQIALRRIKAEGKDTGAITADDIQESWDSAWE